MRRAQAPWVRKGPARIAAAGTKGAGFLDGAPLRTVPAAVVRRVPFFIFVVMLLAVAYQALPELGEAFFGRYYVDAWGTQWFYWYTEHKVLGDAIADTSMFFYPWGKDIYAHTGGNILDAILAVPLRLGLGPEFGYNAFIFLVVLSNVWGMRRLLGELGLSPWSAWLTGVLFAFNPFLLTELRDGRPTQAVFVFSLLFWTYWLRAGTGWRATAAAGVFLALTGLTYWYYAILSAPAALAVTLFDRQPGAFRGRIAAGALAGVLVLPFALGMLTAKQVPGLFDVSLWSATTWSPMTTADLPVGILAFDPWQRMSGFWVPAPEGGNMFIPEWMTMVRAQVVLAAVGLVFGSRRVRIVGLCILLPSLLIAIGPEFMGIPNTPYLLAVKYVRVLQRLWWPARALAVFHVGLMVLAAPAWEGLVRWPRSRAILALTAATAWILDLKGASLAPIPAWSSEVPDVYLCLAKDKARDPVFELPYAFTQAHLYYQTVHEHPIFGGMVEDNKIFTPEAQQAIRADNSFVRGLISIADGDFSRREFAAEDKAALRDLGYRWVLLDKLPYRNPPAFPDVRPRTNYTLTRATLESVLGEPVYEDESGVLWAPWGGSSPCSDSKPTRRPMLRHRSRGSATQP